MQQDDYVIVTKAGDLRFSREVQHDKDGPRSDEGEVIGRVIEVRDPPADSIVELYSYRSAPNITPPRASVGTLREQYASGTA